MAMAEAQVPVLSVNRYESEEEEEENFSYSRQMVIEEQVHHAHFTILEKCAFFLCFIFILVLFLCVGLFARVNQSLDEPSFPLPQPKIPKSDPCNPAQCRSVNCMTVAAEIITGVDHHLNPCDDFYAYTCTKWQENHTIPKYQSRIDMQVIAQETIYERIDQIFTTQTELQQPQPQVLLDQDFVLDKKLFVKISDFYQSCMSIDTINGVGLEPLFKELRIIQQLIPLNHYELTNKQLQKSITYLADQKIWTLFELRMESDIFDPSKPSLFLWNGHVGLPDAKLYDDSKTMSVYFHSITSTIQAVFGDNCVNEFEFNTRNSLSLARQIVEFERKLVRATRFSFRDPEYMERWTIQQLQDNLPMIQWERLLQSHLEMVPEYIMVPRGGFIQNLKQQVFGTTNPRTLRMYFVWRALWQYVDILGDKYAAPKRQLQAYLTGVEAIKSTPARRDVCIDVIDKSALGLLIGRYFLKDREQEIIRAKEGIEGITTLIIQLIKKKVEESDWIHDTESRLEIISKLDKIEFQIGFSDSEPNIRDTVSLTEYYKEMVIIKGDFFGNMLRNYRFESRQTWRLIGKSTYDKQSWKVNAQSLKITYHQELNKVIIPAGLLQYPYYDSKGPLYLYIGTIGWMIGHEIMHGFDNMGRDYDEEGRYRKWLNDDILRRFDEKNECLIDQYYQYGVDGRDSVNNNFADQGGVLFIELVKDMENMTSLPGLDQWTYEQLSYIQFARMKCSKTTKEEQLLRRDHALDNLRVNVPLINSEHFSRVFNCPKGTYMNPSDVRNTCKIW